MLCNGERVSKVSTSSTQDDEYGKQAVRIKPLQAPFE
jgi:hypothetical protein